MRLQTVLNHVQKFKSFVYEKEALEESPEGDGVVIKVWIRPREGARAVCSGCGQAGPTYDHTAERTFDFVPLWAIPVLFLYRMRRVDCPECGVRIEQVPWCDGKNRLTHAYRWFLAGWAKRLSWKEVADVFGTSWDSVYRSVRHAVLWGLVHRRLENVTALGIDEVAWKKGHRYLTLVYQINDGVRRLIAVTKDRTEASLNDGLRTLGERVLGQIDYVCSDMWQPYLKVLRERLPDAVHVLDRFHIMQKFGKALDEIRAGESKQLKADGYEPVLKRTRWLLLKRPENLTDTQTASLSELLQYNLKRVRAYLLREDFQRFWDYVSPYWAGRFLDDWCRRTMRSRLEPMKKVARTLRGHRELLLNWFRARGTISSGPVEGMNTRLKLVTRKSYGFRSYKAAETALFHNLGDLPTPELNHRFC